jgi:hypothetical protein
LVAKKGKQFGIDLDPARIDGRTKRISCIQHIDEVCSEDTVLCFLILPRELIRAGRTNEEPGLASVERLKELIPAIIASA